MTSKDALSRWSFETPSPRRTIRTGHLELFFHKKFQTERLPNPQLQSLGIDDGKNQEERYLCRSLESRVPADIAQVPLARPRTSSPELRRYGNCKYLCQISEDCAYSKVALNHQLCRSLSINLRTRNIPPRTSK